MANWNGSPRYAVLSWGLLDGTLGTVRFGFSCLFLEHATRSLLGCAESVIPPGVRLINGWWQHCYHTFQGSLQLFAEYRALKWPYSLNNFKNIVMKSMQCCSPKQSYNLRNICTLNGQQLAWLWQIWKRYLGDWSQSIPLPPTHWKEEETKHKEVCRDSVILSCPRALQQGDCVLTLGSEPWYFMAWRRTSANQKWLLLATALTSDKLAEVTAKRQRKTDLVIFTPSQLRVIDLCNQFNISVPQKQVVGVLEQLCCRWLNLLSMLDLCDLDWTTKWMQMNK